jgi:hypothetical protein
VKRQEKVHILTGGVVATCDGLRPVTFCGRDASVRRYRIRNEDAREMLPEQDTDAPCGSCVRSWRRAVPPLPAGGR